MKKIIKVLGILFALFVVLVIVAVFTLKKMFPPEKIRELVVKTASQQLKREVKLGQIDVGLFSGISVKDFALSESPNFKNGTFIQSGEFLLKFQIIPLLRKKVVIDEIRLESPQIRIVQNSDGKTFNFSDLVHPSTVPAAKPAEPSKSAEPSPISLTISKAKISKGKVEFIDKTPRKIKALLQPIDLTVLGSGFNKPMFLEMAVGVNAVVNGKQVKGDLKAKSGIDLKIQKFQCESLQWKMAGLTLDLKGKIENFLKPEFDLSASIHDVDIQKLSQWVTLPKEIVVLGSPRLGVDVKGGLDDLNTSLSVDLSNVEIRYADLFQKVQGTDFTVKLNGKLKKQKDATLNSLKIKLASVEVELKGDVQNLTSSAPLLKIKVNTNPIDLKEIGKLSRLTVPYQPAGQISLLANVDGNLKLLQMKGTLNLDKVQAKYDKMNLDAVSGQINFTGSSVEISKLTGRLSAVGKIPSDFQIQASVKNFKQPDIFLDANFSALDLGMFLSDEKKDGKKKEQQPKEEKKKEEAPYTGPEIKIQGKMTVGKVIYTKFEGQNAKASWNLTGVTPPLGKINGNMQFEMIQGKINKIPLLSVIAPILRLDPSALVYSKMGGHFNVTQGTAKTEDFQINSPTIDLFAKGSLHLPTNKPDMILTAKLSKGSLGGAVGEFSGDEEGRPTFAFKLKGNWKPVLDTSQIQKKVTEKATQEIKKKATEVLQDQGKKLLEGLFK